MKGPMYQTKTTNQAWVPGEYTWMSFSKFKFKKSEVNTLRGIPQEIIGNLEVIEFGG